jgi:hypothetical protein
MQAQGQKSQNKKRLAQGRQDAKSSQKRFYRVKAFLGGFAALREIAFDLLLKLGAPRTSAPPS